MFAWRISVVIAGMGLLMAGDCPFVLFPEPDDPVTYRDGFEDGLDDWTKGADVPDDPNNPGQKVAWAITRSTTQASEGEASAKFTLDGRQDDGTIWLRRSFAASPLQDYTAIVDFRLWSESESFNLIARPAVYVGNAAPTMEEQFDLSQAANLEPGWRRYIYEDLEVSTGLDGRVHVAVGLSVFFETEITYYIDDVRIEIEPVLEP